MDLKYLGDEAQGADHSIQFAVGHLNRDKRDDVVSHRFQVDFPPAIVKNPGTQHSADSRLGGISGDSERLAQFTNLDARVTDEFQKNLQIGGIELVQIITPVHCVQWRLIILTNFRTDSDAEGH